ncbi:DUF4890 domain-containing protein [Adhaeribacter radiodurans]|uniref:DUF4890 domain-containing protein n=1 Tax=Adhaeribacter radiodurans TaxID=2745197 RepID=A0A7L7L7Y0_9BACT|nr:DUF4890 domain-containing protein [Adhaeribacter radiodurans]QMU28920.1 DUF4890 domain-containing protein [Adhaeribacter radiodurans]
MKKVLIALAVGFFTVSASYAQTNNQVNTEQQTLKRERATPEQRALRQTKMMSKSLDLTAEQEAQLQTLNLKRLNEMQGLRGKFNSTDGSQNNGFRKEAKVLRDNYETQLKSILTTEQFTKYQTQRKEMREHGSPKMRERNS